jgi:hypothetical protein
MPAAPTAAGGSLFWMRRELLLRWGQKQEAGPGGRPTARKAPCMGVLGLKPKLKKRV